MVVSEAGGYQLKFSFCSPCVLVQYACLMYGFRLRVEKLLVVHQAWLLRLQQPEAIQSPTRNLEVPNPFIAGMNHTLNTRNLKSTLRQPTGHVSRSSPT